MPSDDMTPTTGENCNVDQDGDIVLVLGLGGPGSVSERFRNIRVSSKTLSLASPVFAAMFSPQWNHGNVPESPYQRLPRRIALPEDDVDAMTWICRELHSHDDHFTQPELFSLETIAILCDKYNITTALTEKIGKALRYFRQSQFNFFEENELLAIMYISLVIDDHEIFWLGSHLLVYVTLCGCALEVNTMPPTASLFQNGTIEALMRRRQALLGMVETRFENMITPILAYPGVSVKSDSVTVLHVLQQIRDIGFWPLSTSFHPTTVQFTFKKLINYKKNDRKCPKSSCNCKKLNLHSQIESLAIKIETEIPGLCLSCYKEGKISRQEGNCMAYAPVLCGTNPAYPYLRTYPDTYEFRQCFK